MTILREAEVRALVRAAIARQARGDASASAPVESCRSHPSHGLLPLAPGGDSGGACLIEPAVGCTHCGYCLSLGH
jgi:hypothetical protein